jgi:hypothetical protein
VWVDTPSSQRPDTVEAKFTCTHIQILLLLLSNKDVAISLIQFSNIRLSDCQQELSNISLLSSEGVGNSKPGVPAEDYLKLNCKITHLQN